MPNSANKLNTFRRSINTAVIPPVLILALLALLLLAQIGSLISTMRWVDHSDRVIAQANLSVKLMVDMETGERGYLLTGASQFLEPYNKAKGEVGPAFDDLERMVADNPGQFARVQQLHRMYIAWANGADADLDKFSHRTATRHIVFKSVELKAMMDDLRQKFRAFLSVEMMLREAREQTAQSTTTDALVGTAARAILGGLFVGLMTVRSIRTATRDYEASLADLRQAHELLYTTFHSIGDAVMVTDAQGRITQMNSVAEQLTGWSMDKAQGKDSADVFRIFNESTRDVVESPIARVIQTGMVVGLANHTVLVHRDGHDIHIDDSGAPIRGNDGSLLGVVLVFRDIGERRRHESTLKASEERLRLAVEGANIGTWHWDIQTNALAWSDTMRRLLALPEVDVPTYDMLLSAVHPEDRDFFNRSVMRTVESKSDYDIEFRVLWPDGTVRWQVARGKAYENDRDEVARMEGIAIDVTERKQAEAKLTVAYQRQVALNKISDVIRRTRDPIEVQEVAMEALAEALHVDRCLSTIVDRAGDYVRFVAEWHRADLAPLRGDYTLTQFHIDLDEMFPAAAPLVVADIEASELSPETVAMVSSLRIRSLLEVPFSVDGEVVGLIGVHMADGPRVWTRDEVSFVEAVASQIRAASEAARMLSEAHERAEREVLINRIGEAVRTSSDPRVIQQIAVAMLGEALKADRCYFATYDLERGIVTVGHDWHRPDLHSIQGEHPFVNTVEMFRELYRGKPTSVVPDRLTSDLSPQTLANMEKLQLRSRVSVAVADTNGMGTLTACMSDTPRNWTPEEVAIVERVATKLRSAIEMARVQHREHRIATQLQDALQPAVPADVRGLEIAVHTKPALDEAEVGGDFYDVFAVGKDRYAIVIGDVSGKGLAAAAQLATIRNSLRAALYQHNNPAESVTILNNIVTVHDLLVGFVTAFVGLYDARTGTVTYASCGHEPPIIRRAGSGALETLVTTGPPMGAAAGATYTEGVFKLSHDDLVLLYTDGLSEAGPDRSTLLGIEGVKEMFNAIPADTSVDELARQLLSHAGAFASGAFRDDVCVMVVRRQDT